MSDHFLSHSNSFGFEMGKDAAGCRAFNRNFIVGGENVTKSKNKNSYSNLNRLNTQELEALLQRDIEDSGGGNTDMVMYILETLERREGGISETDKEATARALKEFFSIYAIPEGEGLQLYPCAVLESEGLTAKKFSCEFVGHN